jgi:hypothetical protein
MSIYGPSSTSSSSSGVSEEDSASRRNRANRFSKTSKAEDQGGMSIYGPGGGKASKKKAKQQQLHQHQQNHHAKAAPAVNVPIVPLTEEDLENMKVIGTCQHLEKDYFRLTSAPAPSTVRPEHVLRQALEFVKHKWIEEKYTNKEINSYVLSQFKSLRQDLTLQHISNGRLIYIFSEMLCR